MCGPCNPTIPSCRLRHVRNPARVNFFVRTSWQHPPSNVDRAPVQTFRGTAKMCSLHTTGVPICKQLCVNFHNAKRHEGLFGANRCARKKSKALLSEPIDFAMRADQNSNKSESSSGLMAAMNWPGSHRPISADGLRQAPAYATVGILIGFNTIAIKPIFPPMHAKESIC